VCRLATQPFPTRLLSSVFTTRLRLHSSPPPPPFVGSNTFVRLDRHVSIVSASCFYWLRQLRRFRRSLVTESAATLVHALVASLVDYCNALLASAPKVTTDKLQRVLNAEARVVSGTNKFDRGLLRLLHTELHWLDVPERVAYKLSVMPYRCMHGQAPQYLMDFCHPTSSVATRQQLRSASRRLLVVPRCRLIPLPDGLSLWLVRRCGILCQTNCALLMLAETNSDNI